MAVLSSEPVAETFASLEALEQAVLEKYREWATLLAGKPEEVIHESFCAHALWPHLGWAFVAVAVQAIEEANDIPGLAEGLHKFLACYYFSQNRFDSRGLHPSSGYDYSQLVDVAVFASAIARFDLVNTAFHAGRPLSAHGFPPRKHAANLLVSLLNPDWPWARTGLERADTFIGGKSGPVIAKAFVGFFRALAINDAPAAVQALERIDQQYCRSDWGRHLPFRKPVFLYGLVCLAHHLRHDLLPAAECASILGTEWTERWKALEQFQSTTTPAAFRFEGELSFLSADPVRTAARVPPELPAPPRPLP
jgi:hypothetical protein